MVDTEQRTPGHSARRLDVRQVSTDQDELDSREAAQTAGISGLRYLTSPRVPTARSWAAWMILVVGLPTLLGSMKLLHDHLAVGAALLLTLLLTVVVAAVGGQLPGLVAAVVGALSVNLILVPPYGTLDVRDPDDTISLAVFVLVSIIVSTLVDQASRRAAEATVARQQAQALSRSAMVLASSQSPLDDLANEACTVLGQRAVAIFERSDDGGWRRLTTAGLDPPVDVSDGTAHPVDHVARHVLVLHGRALDPNGANLLSGLADQIAVALESMELRREAADAEILGRANQLRNAILQAVSHDLRTPLTGIKASVTSLLSPEVSFGVEDTNQLLDTIDEEVDRLDRVVGNLLDMSRLQSGVLQVRTESVSAEEIIAAAAASVGLSALEVDVHAASDLPFLVLDGALAERAMANVLSNAREVQPPEVPIVVECRLSEANPGLIDIAVCDRGPGIPAEDRAIAVLPFQRLGDSNHHQGVGLGLAIANGLTHALGGDLILGDTPGGGLTVTFRFPSGVSVGGSVTSSADTAT